MRHFISIATMTILFLASCLSGKQIIKFPKSPDDTYANPNLKTFFKENRTPSIVLRVPNNSDRVTSNSVINVLYNAIEKELVKQNFSVRDRGLFNELLNKSQTSDYSKIKELTNTDIILEVVNMDLSVLYSTNKITTVGTKKETVKLGNIDYKEKGASAEFKVILVKTNEIAGTYKYNYTPCENGCEIGTFKFTGKKGNKKMELRETVEINTMEEFVKLSTKKLIQSFKE